MAAVIQIPAIEAAHAATPTSGTGALDSSFGDSSSGIWTSKTTSGMTGLTHLLQQSDGHIIVGGIKSGTSDSVVIARLNTNGSLDTSFGTNGYADPKLGTATAGDTAQIALQGDNIIVVGTVQDPTTSSATDLAVTRLTAAGQIDKTFGPNGTGLVAKMTSGSKLAATGVVVQPDSKILVSANAGSSSNFTVLRYNSDGSVDGSFGSASSPFGAGSTSPSTANASVGASDLALQSDGTIVVVGSAKISGQFDSAVSMFSSSGAPLTNSTNGTVLYDVAAVTGAQSEKVSDYATSVTVDSTDRILVSGTVATSPSQAYTMRLSKAGTPDTTFNAAAPGAPATNGIVLSTFDGTSASGAGVVTDQNNQVLSGGAVNNLNLGVQRLRPDGTWDPTLGTTSTPGRESVVCSQSAGAGNSIAMAGGELLVAGTCGGALRVARLDVRNIFNVTLSTTTPTANAGQAVVPDANIPGSLIAGNARSISSAPARMIRLFGGGAADSGSDFAGSDFAGSDFAGSDYAGSDFAGSDFAGSDYAGSDFAGSDYAGSDFAGSDYAGSDFATLTLEQWPLATTTWASVLAGSPCASMPQQSLTLAYVLANCKTAAVAALKVTDLAVDGSPLRRVSLIALSLWSNPASALPAQDKFCAVIARQHAPCSGATGIQENFAPGSTSLIKYELAGDDLSAYYNDPSVVINVVGLPGLSNTGIPREHIAAMNLAITSLGPVLVSSLANPGTFVTCGATCPTGYTLGQASTDRKTVTTATLGQLLTALNGAVPVLSLADMLASSVPADGLNVESLPFDQLRLTSPLPAVGNAAYSVGFDANCGIASALQVSLTLPSGFRILPTSVSMSVAGGAAAPMKVTVNQTNVNQSTLSPAQPVSCTGRQHFTISLTADPSAELVSNVTSSVTVQAYYEQLSALGQAPVTVTDPTNDSAASTSTPNCTQVKSSTTYVDRIGRAGNVDQYCLSGLQAGQSVVVTLRQPSTAPGAPPTNLDLIAFGGKPQSLRGTPFGNSPHGDRSLLVTDGIYLPTSDGTVTPPEIVQDTPLIPGSTIRDASLQRDGTTQAVFVKATDADNGQIRFQVSGYNQANSPLPYGLHVLVSKPKTPLTCAPPVYPTAGVTPYGSSALPTSPIDNNSANTALNANTRSVFLVNKTRLGNIYGASAADTAINAVQSMMQAGAGTPYDVNGQIIYVDAIPGVQQAYAAMAAAADPCAPALRQAVVTAINKYVDSVRGPDTDLRFMTVVGGDEVIPYGLVPDRSAIANEAQWSRLEASGKDSSLSRALAQGYLPSDNPYCDLAPTAYGSTPLYVGNLACGRLVETPSDIAAAVTGYLNSGGVRTPNASLSAGYSWLLDAASAVDSAVGPTVPSSARTVLSGAWTRAQAATAMQAAAHGYISIDAHSSYDQQLSGADFTNKTSPPDLLGTGDLPADLSNAILLTIGCHSGTSVADTYIGNANTIDWAQSVTSRNGVLAGQTGYGLGDDQVLAYSGRLLGFFAQNLNGSVSLGQAMQLAKQRYLALGVASVFDAKAIEEATFYGLPMYRLGSNGQWGGATLPTPPATGTGVTSSTLEYKGSPVLSTSAQTSYTVQGQWSVNGGPFTAGTDPQPSQQDTPNEPIEPLTTSVLKAPNGFAGSAHDAVIEDLTSYDVPNVTPAIGTPTVGNNNPASHVLTAAFPSRLEDVVNTGTQQSLAIVPGQFWTNNSQSGTQRLYTDIKSTVQWCQGSNFSRPEISSVSSYVDSGVAHFIVTTPTTNVRRGVINFLATGSATPTAWTHVEMVNDGNGRWIGTANLDPSITTIGYYFVQLSDGCNVGLSSNKGRNFASPNATQSVQIHLPSATSSNGLYPDPTVVTITAPSGTYTINLDGNQVETCTFPSSTPCTVTITGDGKHILQVLQSGSIVAEAAVPIDVNGPTVAFNSSSWANQTFLPGQTFSTGFDPNSSCTSSTNIAVRTCTGPTSITTGSSTGVVTVNFTATDEFNVTTTKTITYYVDATPPTLNVTGNPPTQTNQTSATFTFNGAHTSPATGQPDTVTFTCKLDTGVAMSCASPYTVSGLADGTHTMVIVAADPYGQTTSQTITWTVKTSKPVLTLTGGPGDPTTAGNANFTWTTSDVSGFTDTAACTIDGNPLPAGSTCSTTGAKFTGLSSSTAATHTFKVVISDNVGNSTSAQYTWTATSMSAQGVVRTLPQLHATVTPKAGPAVAGLKVYFTSALTGKVLNCGGVGYATTDSTGAATCDLTLATADFLTVLTENGYKATFNGIATPITSPLPTGWNSLGYLSSTASAGVLS